MAKKTIAELNIKTSGAQAASKQLDQVGASTERLGRNQTRLGQASASAGRSFAAQSAGLGGVVGVYAAAAANVFALSAAFLALNRAAQFETILKGTEQLATAVGSSATRIVRSLKEITDGQLSVIEAATQANLALSAGFNADQIEQLGEVALKASRALGRNLTDSFQRITRGAIKLEPELLDEIGIFTRIDPAVQAYAASIGKSVTQLTQFERRQAFVNQVIKDGQQAFADITDSGGTAQETFEALVANFTDLALTIGNFIANVLEPFAEFLDKNLGNRLVLLGGIGLLVFGRLKDAITGFAVAGLGTLNSRLSETAERFTNANSRAEDFVAQGRIAAKGFVGGGAFPGAGRAMGAELKRNLQSGMDTRQALQSRKDIVVLMENERRIQASIEQSLTEQGADTKALNAEKAKSVQRSTALAASSKVVNDQISAASRSTVLLASGLNAGAKAAAFLGRVLSRAFAIFNAISIAVVAIQAIGSLFGVDILAKVGELIGSIGKKSRDTQQGVEALAKSATNLKVVFGQSIPTLSASAEELEKFLDGVREA